MKRLFQVLGTLWRGLVSAFIEDVGAVSPETVYRGVIQELKEKRARLADRAARVVVDRNRRQVEFDKASRDLAATERALLGAVAGNNGEVGPLLLAKKKQLTELVTALKPDLDAAIKDVEDVKHDLKAFEARIREVESESLVKTAKYRSAQARNEIRAELKGLSIDGSMQLLEGVRKTVDAEIARANMEAEIDGVTLDRQLEKAQEAGDRLASQSEFEALVAQHQRTQGVQVAVTPSSDDSGGKKI